MKRYIVRRPKDTVEVLILPNKDGSGYQYVNLTKGHICPCRFKTELEALRDMDNKVSEDKILYYEETEEIDKYVRVAELEQENESLENIKNIYIGDLLKARELIKQILQVLKNEDSDYTFALKNTHPVLAEAEQFLKKQER